MNYGNWSVQSCSPCMTLNEIAGKRIKPIRIPGWKPQDIIGVILHFRSVERSELLFLSVRNIFKILIPVVFEKRKKQTNNVAEYVIVFDTAAPSMESFGINTRSLTNIIIKQ